MVHVRRRVVKAERHLVLPAGIRELAHDVFSVRCARDFVVGIVRVEHTKPIAVFCGLDHVPLSAFTSQINPRLRVKPHRIEASGQRAILRLRDFAGVRHDRPGCFHANRSAILPRAWNERAWTASATAPSLARKILLLCRIFGSLRRQYVPMLSITNETVASNELFESRCDAVVLVPPSRCRL